MVSLTDAFEEIDIFVLDKVLADSLSKQLGRDYKTDSSGDGESYYFLNVPPILAIPFAHLKLDIRDSKTGKFINIPPS